SRRQARARSRATRGPGSAAGAEGHGKRGPSAVPRGPVTKQPEPDPTQRFTDRAADYVKYRPGYPAAAIDAVIAGLGPPEGIVAVDVGAGTGISARLLAARGVNVVAVEPNRAMRESAVPHERVTWRDGTAEATALDDASFGLALAAQSFHWFKQDDALR